MNEDEGTQDPNHVNLNISDIESSFSERGEDREWSQKQPPEQGLAAIYSVWSLLKTLNQGSRLICHALIFNQPNLNPLDLKTSRLLEGTS